LYVDLWLLAVAATVVVVVARVVVLAISGLVSSTSLVFPVGTCWNHRLQLCNSSRACASIIDVGPSVKGTFLEVIDNLLVKDINDGSTLVEELTNVVEEGNTLLLLERDPSNCCGGPGSRQSCW
jgi:hypothetical protein